MEMIYFTNRDKLHSVFACQIDTQTDKWVTLVNRKRAIPKSAIDSKEPWCGQYYFSSFEKINAFLNPNAAFETQYQLLGRLQSDCKAYIDGSDKNHLWAGNPYDQIRHMRLLLQQLPEVPEWCTEKDIDHYERIMCH